MKIVVILLFGLLSFVFLARPLRTAIKNKIGIKQFIIENKELIIVSIILLIGTLVRIVGIDKLPNALNVDEASSGYDAFSLMKWGIDRSGRSFPVYLYAWGSGQSALYSYMMIPFLFIFNLNEYAIRLPMAIVGVASLYVFYLLLEQIFENKKISIIGLAFFAICPWHIMKSRWGMECNLFPDFVLYATYFFTIALKTKKEKYFIISFIIFAISSYAYSTSYVFLPVYVIGFLYYFIVRKEIEPKNAIKYLIITGIVCIPIFLYIMVSVLDLEEMTFLGVTIPKLTVNRYNEVSTVFSDNMYESCVNNLVETLRIILLQSDGLEWNSIPVYGIIYTISVIFLVIGIIACFKKYRTNNYNMIMNIWFVSAIVFCAFCIPNINRINILMIPLVYYAVIGIYETISRYKILMPIIVVVYAFLFMSFEIEYYHKDFNNYNTFTSGIKEVSEFCEKNKTKEIYCDYSFKEPYIYFLFYGKYDAIDYSSSVEFFDENGSFDNVKEFDNYHFYLPEKIENGSIVIVPRDTELEYEVNEKEKLTINQFDIYVYE